MSREVERYGVYFADLDPTRGGEIAKTRPVVVVSHDAMNRHLDTLVVCPSHDDARILAGAAASRLLCAGQRGGDRGRSDSHDQQSGGSGERIDRLDSSRRRATATTITEMYGE